MSTDNFHIQSYHQQTKHQLKHYARGPETLDWDSQPDPFRHYAGSDKLPLPLSASEDTTPYNNLFQANAISARAFSKQPLGLLMELSMGLSAWKSFGPDRWSLRINPSSGNLHPTECYLLVAQTDGIDAGLYHYHSYQHQLERRCGLQEQAAALKSVLAEDSFIIGLSSIHKRESWKYGERAYRYCQLDVGHALAAIRYACGLLGWRLRLLDESSDAQIAALLGLDREADFDKAEHESPDLLLQIDTTSIDSERIDVEALLALTGQGRWSGQANRLTDDNFYKWPIIQQAEASCAKPRTGAGNWSSDTETPLPAVDEGLLAADLIRQRRSAQAFDGNAPPLTRHHFARMLDCLLSRPQIPPLDSLPWSPRLHLILFVHRVEGVAPGLYVMPRTEAARPMLQQQLEGKFDWNEVEGLPIYRLLQASTNNAARTLACHQPIASDSAFSLAMLAEFDSHLKDAPWRYRQLYWEAGVIGQSLYLEAEAAGARGTGIGCYFDDALHEMLEIEETGLQDLYHFTVGTPSIDSRLQSEPPYAHLGER